MNIQPFFTSFFNCFRFYIQQWQTSVPALWQHEIHAQIRGARTTTLSRGERDTNQDSCGSRNIRDESFQYLQMIVFQRSIQTRLSILFKTAVHIIHQVVHGTNKIWTQFVVLSRTLLLLQLTLLHTDHIDTYTHNSASELITHTSWKTKFSQNQSANEYNDITQQSTYITTVYSQHKRSPLTSSKTSTRAPASTSVLIILMCPFSQAA